MPSKLRLAGRCLAAAVVAALFAPLSARSAEPPTQPGAFERELSRIFEKREYTAKTMGDARWIDGGHAYTTLEAAETGMDGEENPAGARNVANIVAHDTASGKTSVLVAGSKLVPPGAQHPLTIDDYQWSSGRARLLVFTNAKKVWRRNTRGDYWVLDVASGSLLQLGGDAPASSLMFARFSPDGGRVAWVRDNDLWVEDLAAAKITRLTATGSETTINGTTDWVTEEELGLREAFRWSPDGRSIAYWSFDTTGVGVYTLIDDTDSLYPTVKRYPYPKAGTTNSAVRIGVVSAAGGDTRWIPFLGDAREHYIARMEWAGDSQTLVFERLNRLQNLNELLLADVSSGARADAGSLRPIFRDEAKTWVDITREIKTLAGGRAFLVESEKDGWRHVYRIPRDGSPAALVTRFEGDVIDVVGADEKGGWLYFAASPDKATERHLYRCRLDGTATRAGAVERVGPARAGSETWDLSPDERWAFHGFSRFDEPPTYELVRLPEHTTQRVLVDNAALKAKITDRIARPVEFFQLPIGGGVVLDGWILKPREFDPARKYPVVVHVYGEPAGTTVVDRWGGSTALFHRALADLGYVIVSFDNRGTPAPKGAAWRKIVYGTVGDLSSKDQAAAVRALAAARPYVDAARVAIWGWSGGGSNTLNAMFRFPDVYKVGVSVAPVPDERLYDTIYQERYMGLPAKNAEGYRTGSPISFAEGLKGKLLVVHGSGDDNVHYQGTEKLVNRLVELGKPFDLMVYPNRTHSINEGNGTSLHVYSLIARYIREHLPPD